MAHSLGITGLGHLSVMCGIGSFLIWADHRLEPESVLSLKSVPITGPLASLPWALFLQI